MRLDQYIASHFSLSRSQAAKAICEGLVRVNEEIVRKPAKEIGQEATVAFAGVKEKSAPPLPHLNPNPIPILYEDPSCLVIDKPQGIEVTELLEMMREQCGIPSLLLAHRLDKGTSGCLLLAKGPAFCDALQEQFKERSIEKLYLAVVAGVPKDTSATIEAPIGRNLTDRKKMSLFRTSSSRDATTIYRMLAENGEVALLACRIMTGRTHQIRVHLQSIGHPILGDRVYGSDRSRAVSERESISLPCLHALLLSFHSPATGKTMRIEAPLPTTFQNALEHLGLRWNGKVDL